MGEKEINIIEIEKKYSDKFSKILQKLVESEKMILLSEYLEKKSDLKNIPKIIDDLDMIVEHTVYGYVQYYATAQYLYMKKSNNWSEAGQDRVRNSFFSVLLEKKSNEELSYSDFELGEACVTETADVHHLTNKNESELQDIIKNPNIRVFDMQFSFTETERLNKLLQILGSNRRVMMGLSGEFITMIFGVANSNKYHTYDIYQFYQEEMRTPNAVSYIVAVIDQNQIAIRREVCEYIFYKKWIPAVEVDSFMYGFMGNDSENKVSEGIKKKVFECFSVEKEDDLIGVKEDFITKMVENFSYHEIAHNLLEDFNLTEEEIAIVNAISSIEENVLTVANEVLTEWMPTTMHLKGPLQNIVDIAVKRNDVESAKKLLYIYMSDGWFLDTDTEFMYSYSYIMFSAFINFFDEDNSFDFVELFGQLKTIFDFFLDWFRNTISEILVFVKQTTYKDTKGSLLSYSEFSEKIKRISSLLCSDKDNTEEQQLNNFWLNFFAQVNALNPDIVRKIGLIISERSKILYRDCVYKFGSQEESEKYGEDIRSFVIDRMIKAGFESVID